MRSSTTSMGQDKQAAGRRRIELDGLLPSFRCACIAQLVEQLTLKHRHAVDVSGCLWTSYN
jgi:hypothetical protein